MMFCMKALRGPAAMALLAAVLLGCSGTPRPDPTPLERVGYRERHFGAVRCLRVANKQSHAADSTARLGDEDAIALPIRLEQPRHLRLVIGGGREEPEAPAFR